MAEIKTEEGHLIRVVSYEERIAELEKENADLTARLNAINLLTPELEKRSKLKKQQLSKAKEIIKTLLSSKTDFDERRFALWAWKEEVNKAEQFLKEIKENE